MQAPAIRRKGNSDPVKRENSQTYPRIYQTVARIPKGRVSTYGRIAQLAVGCTARMVGYALHRLPDERANLPWHRVVNAGGRISTRSDGDGAWIQRELLEAEGVEFDERSKIDLERFGWPEEG
jgi:methylated-DNA-protein-cysteine methyltransferase-like protein